jgi:hypothetical protein
LFAGLSTVTPASAGIAAIAKNEERRVSFLEIAVNGARDSVFTIYLDGA